MLETEPDRGRWKRLTRSLSAKLISLLLLVMTGIFGLLGYLNIHLHRQHLEQNRLGKEGDVTVSCLPAQGDVHVRLLARGSTRALAEAALAPVEAEVRAALGADCYGQDDDLLEAVVGRLLLERGWTVSLAESCTGGLVGRACERRSKRDLTELTGHRRPAGRKARLSLIRPEPGVAPTPSNPPCPLTSSQRAFFWSFTPQQAPGWRGGFDSRRSRNRRSGNRTASAAGA